MNYLFVWLHMKTIIIKSLWSNRNILLAKTLEVSDFGDETLIALFLCRILGLCLLQNELCPITLNRHVIKVLLGRKVRTFLHTHRHFHM